MSKIKVQAIDQNITFKSLPRIYSGDVNTDYIQFEFDETWEGYTKTAVFYRTVDKPYFQVVKGDECVIPHEVLLDEGKFYVGVVGVLDDKVLTTEVIAYEIGKGARTPIGEIVTPPSQDIWQQILGELASIRELSQNMATDQEQFKQQITQDNTTFKNQINQDNTQFKEDMTQSFDDYVESANTNIEGFKTQATQDLTDFKGKIETDNTNFKTATQSDFDEYYQSLIEARLPKQLLINNDFQVNQREQSEYVNNTSNIQFTLDKWELAYGKVTVLENGVKVTPSSSQVFFNQKISYDLTDKNITLVLKETNGTMHTLKGVVSKTQRLSSKSGNVTLYVEYISSSNLYKIGTTHDSETSIEYIDLFEGDIAYPHVKEDYNIALQRCEYYLRKCNFSVPQLYVYGSSSPNKRMYMITVPIYGEMKSIPTLVRGYITYYASSASGNALTIKDLIVQYVDKNIINIKTPVVDEISSYSQGFRGSILLSCE